jgi:virginiamycin B lyase
MTITRVLLSFTIAVAALIAAAASRPAAAQNAAALTGQVSSAEEGAMEGVVVSARKDGSTVTYSVVSDDKGHFSFPAAKLDPGHYTLSTRAVGYDLDGPKTADIAAGAPASADMKLVKTKNLSHQLTNAEWMLSVPGTEEQKTSLINCVSCHTNERIVKSTHDADEFVQVLTRMANYAQVSQPIKPQVRMEHSRAENPEKFRKTAEWLASINLSQGSWQYELKTLPRVKGRGTHVLITEYDLPRKTIEPHDVIVDAQGTVWYSNFAEEFLGKLDPKTGQASEFPLPQFKQGYPTGSLDLEFDKSGNIWLGMMYQAGIMKFDPQTEKFQFWQIPSPRNREDTQLNMITMNFDVDGKVWTNDAGPSTIFRLDVNSGKFEEFDPLSALPGGHSAHSIYDIAADSQNNLYVTDFVQNYIVRIDAKTGKYTSYQVPTPFSRNRRGNMDDHDRMWFAEYRGNKIAMLDTKNEEVKEWPMPTHTHPYDVVWDKNGNLWTGGMTSDRVVRLDPKSGETVEYPLPRDTNMRRMFVDDSTTPPTFWVGSNHGASIVKVEPLD